MRWKLWIALYSGLLVWSLIWGTIMLIYSAWKIIGIAGYVMVVVLGYMIYWNFKKLRQEREREVIASEPE